VPQGQRPILKRNLCVWNGGDASQPAEIKAVPVRVAAGDLNNFPVFCLGGSPSQIHQRRINKEETEGVFARYPPGILGESCRVQFQRFNFLRLNGTSGGSLPGRRSKFGCKTIPIIFNVYACFAEELLAEPPQCFNMNPDWNQLQKLATSEIEKIMVELPKPLREQAQQLPVTFDRTPSFELQIDGIEVDTLGLFTGAEFADEGETVLPAQIILFLDNIWDIGEGDEKVFCEEVRTTFLHELGHFFGLNEDDLTERGLE
jgi:predicted Zn-dependent protease with MMP-like domain